MSNTIERKKKKGGAYEFYVAGDDGEKLKMLMVDGEGVSAGQEIDELFYLATYLSAEEERELTSHSHLDRKGNPYTYMAGGGDIQVKALLWRSGELIFAGIKKLVLSISERQEFILILEGKVQQRYRLSDAEKMSRTKSLRSGAELNCVIDDGGNFVISPTYHQISYNSKEDRYLLEDCTLE